MRGDLAQQAARFAAIAGQLIASINRCLMRSGLGGAGRMHVRLRDERLRRTDQQQQQYRKAFHSMALVISSTIFFASPNTIIVLSM